MQPFSAALLTGDRLDVVDGLELVDAAGNVIADLSDDLVSVDVSRNMYADVHGTCSISLSRALAWGRDRVRPYAVVSDGVVSERHNKGVFVLTTPQRKIGEDPVTYDVDGYDLLYLLQSPLVDTHVAEAGTTYLQAVRDAITASGAGSTVRLDGTLQDTPLPGPMVWCLSDEPVTWLQVVNDLLKAINYRGIWADESGAFRSEPYRDPAQRPVEMAFTTGKMTILSDDGTETNDVWSAPNWWRFIRKGMTTWPTVGDGIYEPDINATDPAQTLAGRIVPAPVQWLDAADQASLVAQGDRIVATDRAVTRLLEYRTGPFPAAGHFDIATIDDPRLGGLVKVQARSWHQPSGGGDVEWTFEVVDG